MTVIYNVWYKYAYTLFYNSFIMNHQTSQEWLDRLEQEIKEAVDHVKPGRVGWTLRFHRLSSVIEPHKDIGRIVVYQSLLCRLRQEMEEYAAEKNWPIACYTQSSNKLDSYFKKYIFIPITKVLPEPNPPPVKISRGVICGFFTVVIGIVIINLFRYEWC